ncbi:MAG TPA: hemerythrin domain-containing protein [Acidimicrobiales bacterium]|nr:hemerythrin domain-containing protein [Acidimicrobiales bacterium]
MPRTTDPLREDQAELLAHVDAFRSTADAVGDIPVDELCSMVDARFRFLVERLLPHATAEDTVLYPAVERVLGPGTTATMRRDHVEVDRLTGELRDLRDRLAAGGLDDWLANDLRRVLYGLYAFVRLHVAKEQELYLPVLDSLLPPNEAPALFDQMAVVAGQTPSP